MIMSEIENIKNNTNGEIPSEKYEILRVVNIDEPAAVLADLKNLVSEFLENKELSWNDNSWNKILPERIIEFTRQLTEEDYFNDDLISHISSIVHQLQTIKDWVWYSSKITESGFDVYMIGEFHGPSVHLIHHLGIPLSNIFFVSNGNEFSVGGRVDVLSYRQWNPKTLILSPGKYNNEAQAAP